MSHGPVAATREPVARPRAARRLGRDDMFASVRLKGECKLQGHVYDNAGLVDNMKLNNYREGTDQLPRRPLNSDSTSYVIAIIFLDLRRFVRSVLL